jgi:sugar/nucleoside kinase (ribokinase family)
LHLSIVEHIINIVSNAGIEIVLYASPGEPLLTASYPKVSHLICNRFDAQRMLGYVNLEDLDDPDTWPEVVNNFYSAKGVHNVVLKVGPLGAYFKNHEEEGYASGYSRPSEVVDASGAT